MVLTGSAVTHKYFADLFTRTSPPAARRLVESVQNCEDILFSFVMSRALGSGLPSGVKVRHRSDSSHRDGCRETEVYARYLSKKNVL